MQNKAASNKLINVFMGTKKSTYNSCWDNLMLVVSKIESLTVMGHTDLQVGEGETTKCEWEFSVEIMNGGCMIHRDIFPQYYGTEEDFLDLYDCRKKDKIKSTYQAVVFFIKWYNKQIKNINQ